MEVLFKDDKFLYTIKDCELYRNVIKSDTDLTNIKHLDDVEVLYHYRDIKDGELYPVYYEHYCVAITKKTSYFFPVLIKDMIKDYTLINLKLL